MIGGVDLSTEADEEAVKNYPSFPPEVFLYAEVDA